MESFRVRLNCVDHYQAAPSEFDPPLPYNNETSERTSRPKVPVIRIFGATETGQKVCVHVHGAFPYLYIRYDGTLSPKEVRSARRNLHQSIDHVLATSYNRNADDRKSAFVAHITLVKGVPFYGYHVGYQYFFKIYLLNPIYVKRLADLLLQGMVMKRPLQPYESHLQYIPQWMCDYNLYGCAYVNASKFKFRPPVPEYLELDDLFHRWHDRSIRPDWISDSSVLPRQSYCSLEVDICVHDILNRFEIKERPLHHDFMEFQRQVTSSKRLVPSMAGLWQDETRRRAKCVGIEDPKSSPFAPEDLVSMSVGSRRPFDGGWAREGEYRELVSQITAEEAHEDKDRNVSIENYLEKVPFEDDVETALESVQDFFPGRFDRSRLEMHQMPHDEDHEVTDIHASEAAILLSEANEALYDSDVGYNEDGELLSGDDDQSDGLFNMTFPSFSEQDISMPSHAVSGIAVEAAYKQELAGARELGNDVLDKPGYSDTNSDLDTGKRGSGGCLKRPFFQDEGLERTAKRIKDCESSKQALQGALLISAKSKRGSSDGVIPNVNGYNANAVEPSQQKHIFFQKNATREADRQDRLSFLIVKDPMDPMAILRFSQDDGKPLKKLSPNCPAGENSRVAEDAADAVDVVKGSQLFSSSFSDRETDVWATPVSELLPKIHSSFNIPLHQKLYALRFPCPTPKEVSSTFGSYGFPSAVYQEAHYSDESDVPERSRNYAGRDFRLMSNTLQYLPDFDPTGRLLAVLDEQPDTTKDRGRQRIIDQRRRKIVSCKTWEFAPTPPSRSEVMCWFETQNLEAKAQALKKNKLSQIEGPTQKNDHGFKYSQRAKSTSIEYQTQCMSTMSLEVHVNTRGALSPNPKEDEIACIFWCIQSEDKNLHANCHLPNTHVGVIFQGDDRPEAKISKTMTIDFEHELTELDMINRLVDIVRLHDPDIIAGYEVHNSSWGFLMERAKTKYDFDLSDELSRVKFQAHGRFGKDSDRWGLNRTSSIRVTGRHMINIWRAMRSELNLLQYTMENVIFHLLHRRVPHYSSHNLAEWYSSGKPRDLAKVVNYYVSRVQMNLEIIESSELISRTSEQAKILGIDFYSVFSRGSQFKVESLMFRIAKAENFMLLSPSRKQVGQQNALECLPLVMEPQSDFYTSPMLVLDFQSLYPSVMIAYNYCYSTFLGRIIQWRGQDKMGFTNYERQPRMLELLKDKINISPNGMMYVKPAVRQSLIARMLAEILETRVMVKSSMKIDKDDKALQRLLNNRQLALKLIANVTYGYTSASFSGRMPCAEIADSIVQTGRETLEKAIALIHSVDRWNAEVVYGDTDSLFVYLKGRTREEAFNVGEEIARAVTEANPRPVKLKFEKVYHPCILLAKKRYVGFKYEHRDQKEPEFDAKGIETVRRDGTPAEQKIEETALKILFRTADLSLVKRYFQKQCSKILRGSVSIQDFCFAKEVRLGTYNDNSLLPAGALVSMKKMIEDPRLEPQYGERVPYVVVSGAPGSRLADRCVAPETLLKDGTLALDAEYYITKNIMPPLERIFNLVGANVRQWYDEIPRVQRARILPTEPSLFSLAVTTTTSKKTLDSYLKLSTCVICRARLPADTESNVSLCHTCLQIQPHISLFTAQSRLRQAEKRVVDIQSICRSCTGTPLGDEVKCDSRDCPIFYSRMRAVTDFRKDQTVLGPVIEFLEGRDDRLSW